MKISRRSSLLLIIITLVLLLGILFREFVRESFIAPMAITLLFFWRVFLTVDQKYYWGTLSLAIGLFVLSQTIRRPVDFEQAVPPHENATLENVNTWRLSILCTSDEADKPNLLNRNLRYLLAMMFAANQPDSAQYEIDAALRTRQIQVPESVYTFLYKKKSVGSQHPILRFIQTVAQLPHKWFRRWSGQRVIEYYQSIDNALTFMEITMEIRNDDDKTGNLDR